MNKFNWMPYTNALKIVLKDAKKFSINSEKKWHYQYIAKGKKLSNIPSHPQVIYKNKGWVSWSHWLGTKNIRGCLRKYMVNDNFFKKWSHNMAYILGFWFADGCIRKRKVSGFLRYGSFLIFQHIKDKYLLENILKTMKSDCRIYTPGTRKDSCTFEISSDKIYNDIIKLGGTRRKSLTTTFPNVPTKFLADFIRGFFDGDGCISVSSKNHSSSCYFCSGSKKFLDELNNRLFETWGILGRNIYSDTCFRLYFGMKNIIKLGQVMYGINQKNMLKLNRKHNKFIDLIKYRRKHFYKNRLKQEKEKICHKA